MIETGRASIALLPGATVFSESDEARRLIAEAFGRLARDRPAHQVSDPRYIGIRTMVVGEQPVTVAEYEADFEVVS